MKNAMLSLMLAVTVYFNNGQTAHFPEAKCSDGTKAGERGVVYILKDCDKEHDMDNLLAVISLANVNYWVWE